MAKVAVIATLEVDPNHFEAVTASVVAHRERCLRDEPGTLMFELMIPREDRSKLYLYEVYADQAAFDTHWNGSSLARLRAETEDKLKITSAIWGTPAA